MDGSQNLNATDEEVYSVVMDEEAYFNMVYECVKDVQKYDSQYTPFEFLIMEEEIEFDGVQQVEINLPLIMTDFTNPTEVDDTGASYQGEVVALMKLEFSFNPKAGKASHQVFEINQTVEFSGEGISNP